MEALGVRVLLGRSTKAILGNGHVEGVRVRATASAIDADLVVVAAGIRPNVDLGRKSRPRSQPRHRRQRLPGDLPPRHLRRRRMHRAQRPAASASSRRCSNRARSSAATITGNRGPGLHRLRPRPPSSRSWASTSSPPATATIARGVEVVRFEDPSLGVYKKLILSDDKLDGVILVGDASDDHRYMDWLRIGDRPHRPAPPPAVPPAGRRHRARRRRSMPDSAHRLRLHRRYQRRHHRGDPRPRQSARWRS